MCRIDKTAKRQAALKQAEARQIRKKQSRRQFRCFWTWPLGHKYVTRPGGGPSGICAGCNKEEDVDWM